MKSYCQVYTTIGNDAGGKKKKEETRGSWDGKEHPLYHVEGWMKYIRKKDDYTCSDGLVNNLENQWDGCLNLKWAAMSSYWKDLQRGKNDQTIMFNLEKHSAQVRNVCAE